MSSASVGFVKENHNIKKKEKNRSLLIVVGRVFAYGPRDLGSISGRVIPKT